MGSLLALSFLCAILLSAFLTRIVRDVAQSRGWIRKSLSDRHLEGTSKPRLGGVAILLAVIALMSVALTIALDRQLATRQAILQMLPVMAAAAISFGIGLLDDFLEVSAWIKLAAEIIAGTVLWFGRIRVLNLTSLFHSHQFGATASLILTVTWIVLISNAFNLIDGLDGLAAGSALFSVLTVFVVSLANHNVLQSVVTAILAGAILGFLRYNFNPATIFLGDCGSLFIGTLVAATTLTGTTQQKSSTLVAVAIPLIACGLPVVETTVSIVRRFLSGKPIFSADRQHIHHKLLDLGWSQRSVVIALYGVSAVFGVLSLALLAPGQGTIAIVLLVVGIGTIVGVQKLRYQEFFEVSRVARRALEQREVIVNNLSVRRSLERLSKADDWDEIVQSLHDGFEGNDFDGFEFVLEAQDSQVMISYDRWFRSAYSRGESDQSSSWSINLPLISRDSGFRGSLQFHRFDNRALLLDINVLTGELQSELQRACARAMQNSIHAGATVAQAKAKAVSVAAG